MILTLIWNLNFWANLKKSSKTTKQRFFIRLYISILSNISKARQSLKKRVEINLLHAKSTDFQKLSTSGQTEIQQTHVQKSQWKRYNHLRKRRQLQMRSKSMQCFNPHCAFQIRKNRHLYDFILSVFKFMVQSLFTPRKCYFRLFKDLIYLQCTY